MAQRTWLFGIGDPVGGHCQVQTYRAHLHTRAALVKRVKRSDQAHTVTSVESAV